MADGGFDDVAAQDQTCPVCGHDPSAVPRGDVAAAIVDVGRRWREFLGAVTDHPAGMDDLCVRRVPHEWSAIEYACHVRDVLSVCARRIELTLVTHAPELGRWDHEQAAVDDHYLAQHPDAVADDIERGATELAAILQPLSGLAWDRPATRQRKPVTVLGLARFSWHEAIHHLQDAKRVVPAPSI